MMNDRQAPSPVTQTRSHLALTLALCALAVGCSSTADNGDDTSASGGAAPSGTGGVAAAGKGGSGGMVMAGSGGKGGAAGMTGTGGKGGAGGMTGTGGKGGAGGMMGTGGTDAGMPDAGPMGNGSDLTGTLGSLGAVKPVLAGFTISTGVETITYLSSSADLTCAKMMMMGVKWLASLPAGTQIIEIVVRGAAAVQMYPIGNFQGEVNYAEGSKSSSSETVGSAGSLTFTKAEAMGVHEGMISVTAPFMVSGTFHAEWCEGGTEY